MYLHFFTLIIFFLIEISFLLASFYFIFIFLNFRQYLLRFLSILTICSIPVSLRNILIFCSLFTCTLVFFIFIFNLNLKNALSVLMNAVCNISSDVPRKTNYRTQIDIRIPPITTLILLFSSFCFTLFIARSTQTLNSEGDGW